MLTLAASIEPPGALKRFRCFDDGISVEYAEPAEAPEIEDNGPKTWPDIAWFGVALPSLPGIAPKIARLPALSASSSARQPSSIRRQPCP